VEVARRPPSEEAEPGCEALITIHGRVYPGLLRRRSWSQERGTWQWSVEIAVDDRRVLTTVWADQISCVRRRSPQ
jgi:hypothetical protein